LEKPKTAVLRWGHRFRDRRVTTHVALVARAFGASEFILADIKDAAIKETVEKIVPNWGGEFGFDMGKPWKKVVSDWRSKGGMVVHLTVYGENIKASDVMDRIKAEGKDILIIVGSQKVPSEFFSQSISDFNVAVGNQPHSEVSGLAVFLDYLYEGKQLATEFKGAKLKIVPQKRGKRVLQLGKLSAKEQQI